MLRGEIVGLRALEDSDIGILETEVRLVAICVSAAAPNTTKATAPARAAQRTASRRRTGRPAAHCDSLAELMILLSAES
jgi:hypothetical protein